jgi:hypothetical protein
MRKAIIACAGLLVAACAFAGDVTWTVTSNPTNAAAEVSGTAAHRVGALESIHVYLPAGVTGTVSVALQQPYGGPSLVLATNADTVAYRVFSPRIAATDSAGASAWSVTNNGDRVWLSGETLTATISAVSVTNSPILFRAVYEKGE